MAVDEEKNEDVVEETPQDETSQTAGPAAGDAPPANPPEDQHPASPAEEESETDGDAPPAEEEAEKPEGSAEEAEAPAEEEKAEEPVAEAEEPAAEGEAEQGGESEAAAGEPAAAEDDDGDWKARKRLERSRQPHTAKPQRGAEERDEERREGRKRLAVQRRKRREAAKGQKGEPGAGTPPAEREPNAAKVRQGIVVSDKADKTITVRIDFARRHPAYEKIVRRTRTLHAHDERNEAGAGDTVRVVETRPLSKTKRWRLVEIVEKAR